MSQGADSARAKPVGTLKLQSKPTQSRPPSHMITFEEKEDVRQALDRVINWWQKHRFKIVHILGFCTAYYPTFSIEYTFETIPKGRKLKYKIVGEDGVQERAIDQYRVWKDIPQKNLDTVDLVSIGSHYHYIIVFYYENPL